MLSLILCKWKPKPGIAARFTVVMCNHHVAAIDIIMPESTVTIRSQGAMGAMTPLVNALASKVALH